MNREEQIIEAGKLAASDNKFSDLAMKQHRVMSAYEMGFIDGAVWADSHPQWIPVEERLPEERKVVWVHKHFNEEFLGEFDIYDSAAFCNGEFQCDNSGNVTHWMQLPQPPRKEDKK